MLLRRLAWHHSARQGIHPAFILIWRWPVLTSPVLPRVLPRPDFHLTYHSSPGCCQFPPSHLVLPLPPAPSPDCNIRGDHTPPLIILDIRLLEVLTSYYIFLSVRPSFLKFWNKTRNFSRYFSILCKQNMKLR